MAAEHRRKRRRVRKEKKAAVAALIVLFIAGAADRRSIGRQAATLPTGYGAANVAATMSTSAGWIYRHDPYSNGADGERAQLSNV